jgi:hypothetical protein
MRDFFSFDRFITPQIIKIIFVIGLVLLFVGTLLRVGFALIYGGGLLWGIIVPILVMCLAVLLWRVYCEVMLVFFDMRNRLQALAERPRI